MNMYDIIEKKRNNKILTKQEIDFFVNAYTASTIPDYQMSALLMAICINGMCEEEIFNLTNAMINSGDKIDLSSIEGITVDKHSTGGVGDKTTLIILPIVASIGGKIAKMSGKGLGYTGGTIDKLESIEGFKVQLSKEEFYKQVNEIGVCLVSSTENITPADKKIYALRDVTATIDSIPLIASSVMSKKIAAGSDSIVLDVKVGSGAFMKTIEGARELSQIMVKIGQAFSKRTVAFITNMNVPLGASIGNSLEVKEAIQTLKGRGPEDLTSLCIELATYMAMLSLQKDKAECRRLVENSIQDGNALNKLKEWVKAQGGNTDWIDSPELFPVSKYSIEVISKEEGYIATMDTEEIGKVCTHLGAGRTTKEDPIDYSAGIILNKKTGEYVQKGEVLATLYTNKNGIEQQAINDFLETITYSKEGNNNNKTIYDIIE